MKICVHTYVHIDVDEYSAFNPVYWIKWNPLSFVVSQISYPFQLLQPRLVKGKKNNKGKCQMMEGEHPVRKGVCSKMGMHTSNITKQYVSLSVYLENEVFCKLTWRTLWLNKARSELPLTVGGLQKTKKTPVTKCVSHPSSRLLIPPIASHFPNPDLLSIFICYRWACVRLLH